MLDSVKDLPAVKDMLATANKILGYDILKICIEVSGTKQYSPVWNSGHPVFNYNHLNACLLSFTSIGLDMHGDHHQYST